MISYQFDATKSADAERRQLRQFGQRNILQTLGIAVSEQRTTPQFSQLNLKFKLIRQPVSFKVKDVSCFVVRTHLGDICVNMDLKVQSRKPIPVPLP